MSHAVVLLALDLPEGEKPNAKLVENLVAYQMTPFDEGGKCFKNGSRWDWYEIGGRWSGVLCGVNVIQRKDFSKEKWATHAEIGRAKTWEHYLAFEPANMRKTLFGIEPGTTREEFLSQASHVSFYAFLRKLTWHENDRMGWFGGSAKTECELVCDEKIAGKCVVQDKETGAKIVCWRNPDELWTAKYWSRFIEPLPPETVLVAVDYHV